MRARMALAYSGGNFEIREILLRDKPAHMLSLSAKGTVPVLVLVDGTILDESLDVMSWALAQHDPDGWNVLSDAQRKTGADLVKTNDGDFKFCLDRYKYSSRFPEKTMEQWRDDGFEFLKHLDEALSAHRYLLGEDLSFVDVALFPFVRQFAHVDLEWFKNTGLHKLIAWYEEHMASELFTSVMKKYPLWQEGDAPLHFKA
jgi:glutathione S-transferase